MEEKQEMNRIKSTSDCKKTKTSLLIPTAPLQNIMFSSDVNFKKIGNAANTLEKTDDKNSTCSKSNVAISTSSETGSMSDSKSCKTIELPSNEIKLQNFADGSNRIIRKITIIKPESIQKIDVKQKIAEALKKFRDVNSPSSNIGHATGLLQEKSLQLPFSNEMTLQTKTEISKNDSNETTTMDKTQYVKKLLNKKLKQKTRMEMGAEEQKSNELTQKILEIVPKSTNTIVFEKKPLLTKTNQIGKISSSTSPSPSLSNAFENRNKEEARRDKTITKTHLMKNVQSKETENIDEMSVPIMLESKTSEIKPSESTEVIVNDNSSTLRKSGGRKTRPKPNLNLSKSSKQNSLNESNSSKKSVGNTKQLNTSEIYPKIINESSSSEFCGFTSKEINDIRRDSEFLFNLRKNSITQNIINAISSQKQTSKRKVIPTQKIQKEEITFKQKKLSKKNTNKQKILKEVVPKKQNEITLPDIDIVKQFNAGTSYVLPEIEIIPLKSKTNTLDNNSPLSMSTMRAESSVGKCTTQQVSKQQKEINHIPKTVINPCIDQKSINKKISRQIILNADPKQIPRTLSCNKIRTKFNSEYHSKDNLIVSTKVADTEIKKSKAIEDEYKSSINSGPSIFLHRDDILKAKDISVETVQNLIGNEISAVTGSTIDISKNTITEFLEKVNSINNKRIALEVSKINNNDPRDVKDISTTSKQEATIVTNDLNKGTKSIVSENSTKIQWQSHLSITPKSKEKTEISEIEKEDNDAVSFLLKFGGVISNGESSSEIDETDYEKDSDLSDNSLNHIHIFEEKINKIIVAEDEQREKISLVSRNLQNQLRTEKTVSKPIIVENKLLSKEEKMQIFLLDNQRIILSPQPLTEEVCNDKQSSLTIDSVHKNVISNLNESNKEPFHRDNKLNVDELKVLEIALENEFIFAEDNSEKIPRILTSSSSEVVNTVGEIPRENKKGEKVAVDLESNLKLFSQTEGKETEKIIKQDLMKNSEMIKHFSEENVENVITKQSASQINQPKRRSRKILPSIIKNKLNNSKQSDIQKNKLELLQNDSKLNETLIQKETENGSNSENKKAISKDIEKNIADNKFFVECDAVTHSDISKKLKLKEKSMSFKRSINSNNDDTKEQCFKIRKIDEIEEIVTPSLEKIAIETQTSQKKSKNFDDFKEKGEEISIVKNKVHANFSEVCENKDNLVKGDVMMENEVKKVNSSKNEYDEKIRGIKSKQINSINLTLEKNIIATDKAHEEINNLSKVEKDVSNKIIVESLEKDYRVTDGENNELVPSKEVKNNTAIVNIHTNKNQKCLLSEKYEFIEENLRNIVEGNEKDIDAQNNSSNECIDIISIDVNTIDNDKIEDYTELHCNIDQIIPLNKNSESNKNPVMDKLHSENDKKNMSSVSDLLECLESPKSLELLTVSENSFQVTTENRTTSRTRSKSRNKNDEDSSNEKTNISQRRIIPSTSMDTSKVRESSNNEKIEIKLSIKYGNKSKINFTENKNEFKDTDKKNVRSKIMNVAKCHKMQENDQILEKEEKIKNDSNKKDHFQQSCIKKTKVKNASNNETKYGEKVKATPNSTTIDNVFSVSKKRERKPKYDAECFEITDLEKNIQLEEISQSTITKVKDEPLEDSLIKREKLEISMQQEASSCNTSKETTEIDKSSIIVNKKKRRLSLSDTEENNANLNASEKNKEGEISRNDEITINEVDDVEISNVQPYRGKKRGRKPKKKNYYEKKNEDEEKEIFEEKIKDDKIESDAMEIDVSNENIKVEKSDIQLNVKKKFGRKSKIKQECENESAGEMENNFDMEIKVNNNAIELETSIIQERQQQQSYPGKKRGRKPKIQTITDYENINSKKDMINSTENDDTIQTETDNEASEVKQSLICVKKKRGRKPKIRKDYVTDDSQGEGNETFEISEVKKKKKDYIVDDRKLHPKLLLVDSRSDLDKSDGITENENESKILEKDQVKCGLCKQVTFNKLWIKHLCTHYGIGWKDGIENPLDVESFREVLNECIRFFKVNKIKSLKCRLCGSDKKSALGLIGHVELCGLSLEEKQKQSVRCEHCQKLVLPTMLSFHRNQQCPVLHAAFESSLDQTKENDAESTEVIYSNTGRQKRKSVIKAEKKFADFMNDNDNEENSEAKYVLPYKPITGSSLVWRFRLQIRNRGIAKCVARDCTFLSSDISELVEHDKNCEIVPRGGFICVECNFHDNEMNKVIEHYNMSHKHNNCNDNALSGSEADVSDGSSDSEDSEGDDEAITDDDNLINNEQNELVENYFTKGKRIKKRKRRKVMNKNNLDPLNWRRILPFGGHEKQQQVCWKRTKQFQHLNFSENSLFTFALPAFVTMQNPVESYLPRNLYSMKLTLNETTNIVNKSFGSSQIPKNWLQIERFSAEHKSDEKIIFVGGSVTCMSWIPLYNIDKEKAQSQSQYLVIACKKDIYKFVKCVDPEPMQCLILIYEFKNINTFKSNTMNIPKLLYCIPYDNGPIHHIEFLPSGGYDPSLNRIGLMAVANIKSDIHIYSLPLKAPNNCDNYNNVDFISLKPVITLKLDVRKCNVLVSKINLKFYKESQCNKLCWSMAKGHNFIAGAYINGFVAIWKIDNDYDDNKCDNLNLFVIKGIRNYIPVCYFNAGVEIITGLDFHYDVNGVRWLLVTTKYRNIKIYDLKDISCPQILSHTNDPFSINCAIWPIIWENPLYCQTHQDMGHYGLLNSISPLEIHYSTRRVIKTASNNNYIGYSNWQNVCLTGSDNGDLNVYYSPVLNLNLVAKTQFSRRQHISYTDLIRLDGKSMEIDLSNDNIQLFDPHYLEKYGLVIGKLCPSNNCETDITVDERNPPFWMYTYVKINVVACNNNENGNKLYAIGYENGLVRVKSF